MARGGFLRHIVNRFRGIPNPGPPIRRPPPPEPPGMRKEYKDVWRHERTHKRRANFQKNLNLFNGIMRDLGETDPDERLALWESYVKNIVGKSRYRRQSTNNLFWRDSGIDPADFNWQAWREAMGYTGKNRSRTA